MLKINVVYYCKDGISCHFTRKEIWSSDCVGEFDDSSQFQPEELGYTVSRIEISGISYDTLLQDYSGSGR